MHMDFWRFCVFFLIFAYQIFGRDCEIFVNLGPDAAAWVFFVGAPSRRFYGALWAFLGVGISVYGQALKGCTAALYAARNGHKKAARFCGRRGCFGYLFRFAFWYPASRAR